LKILIADLLIRFANEQLDINDLIANIRNNYKKLLLNTDYARDNEMLEIISKNINRESIIDDRKRLLSYMSDSESEDLDIISYNMWLRNNL